MSEIDTIVSVDITVEQDTIARTTFGVPAVMSSFQTIGSTSVTARVFVYESLAEAATAGWATGSAVYKALQTCFSQSPKPAKVIVGRRDTADTDWATALTAIAEENNEWYGFSVIPVATVLADLRTELASVAAWTESNDSPKLFWLQLDDADILNAVEVDDIGSVLKALNYRRSVSCYRATANLGSYFPLGWFAEGAPYKPGSSTYAYKNVANCATDKIGSAARTAAFAKNVNIYTTVAGADITRKGVVANGEYIDVIVGLDKLKASIQESIYAQLVATRKISYDDAGIVATSSIVQAELETAGRDGILQLDSIELTIPKYASIPAADRAARKLTGIKFYALLQGAIHTAAVTGTVSV